ncbi:LacI family DNA-binding transcriptional regulator [Actinocrinis sp.]|uniref:LacI family DNA-binding transcriptional regulator n=1 Tax=Actinocrinis sp. TaxID=1920516 RepID=UPI002DDD27FD|nr:LacI family DNA-binding transcriptional regulator [Actinocrinis sp.]
MTTLSGGTEREGRDEGAAMTGHTPTEPNRPTLRQVAELSEVSLKTASRVFNGAQYVAPDTAARVRAAAEQLGFRPNTIARELRAGARSALVGLIIGDVANPFYARIARGAERKLRAAGLRLISASSDEDPSLERALVSDLLERRVSAMLIVSSETDHGYLQAERSLGTPLVFLDRAPHDIDADAVVLDNRGGITDAVHHLLRHGHRRIAFVGDLNRLPTHLERVAAFEEALAEAGIADWNVYARDGAHDAEAAESEVRALLALPRPPTALITANNRITTGALRALRGRDQPPALIGFDDFDLADLLDVTVIAHDPERMGELGVELLLDRLAGREDPARRVLMPTRLLPRGSGERRAG